MIDPKDYESVKEQIKKWVTLQPAPPGYALSDCWIWVKGFYRPNGYPRLWHKNKAYRGHRISKRVFHGPFDETRCILHQCDVKRCMNPDHLIVGSQLDNVLDKLAKGRDAIHKPKLTDEEVRRIFHLKKNGTPANEIAKLIGVSHNHILAILRGRFRQKIFQEMNPTR
jgi:hypothetical protein